MSRVRVGLSFSIKEYEKIKILAEKNNLRITSYTKKIILDFTDKELILQGVNYK